MATAPKPAQIARINAETERLISVSGTTYTPSVSHSGSTILFTSGSPITVTLSNLRDGSTTKWIQRGAGVITFNSGTLTRQEVNACFKSSGQYSYGEIFVEGGVAILTGRMAP